MTVTTEVKTTTEAAATDRRRPGRLDQVSPSLIPILRTGDQPGELPVDPNESIEFEEPDQIAGARGIFFGVAISAPLWVGIAYLGRWILT